MNTNGSSSDHKTIEHLRGNNSHMKKPKIQHEFKHIKKSSKVEWSGSKDHQPLRNDFLAAIAAHKGLNIKMNFKLNLTQND